MAIYLSALTLIVLVAIGLLAAVSLAAIGEEHADGTRLNGRLRALMSHLNGEAATPKLVEGLLGRTPAATPDGRRPRRRLRQGQQSGTEVSADSPAEVKPSESSRGNDTGRSRLAVRPARGRIAA